MNNSNASCEKCESKKVLRKHVVGQLYAYTCRACGFIYTCQEAYKPSEAKQIQAERQEAAKAIRSAGVGLLLHGVGHMAGKPPCQTPTFMTLDTAGPIVSGIAGKDPDGMGKTLQGMKHMVAETATDVADAALQVVSVLPNAIGGIQRIIDASSEKKLEALGDTVANTFLAGFWGLAKVVALPITAGIRLLGGSNPHTDPED